MVLGKPVRKPKFQGKKTQWEKRRIVKNYTRQTQGKKPLVEPLTIAPFQERRKALAEGKIVFYDGKQRIELPLVRYGRLFQGIYKTEDKRLIVLRQEPLLSNIRFFEVQRTHPEFKERRFGGSINFVKIGEDLGHMDLSPEIRGRGLGLKAVSKAERNVRSKNKGSHRFLTKEKFLRLFEKLGYSRTSAKRALPIIGVLKGLKKKGKFQPKDDLNKFHRIEAINPKTGKTKIFTFPTKKKN